MRTTALFVAVTITPHSDADDTKLLAKISAAVTYDQVQLQPKSLP